MSMRRQSRQQRLTKDKRAYYAGTRARVEARATLEQAEELRRVLAELGGHLEDAGASNDPG
jgi:hypothetical protein